MRRGFTIIETVIVTALAGLLVALLLPSLGSVKHQAVNMGEISKLRQHAMVFRSYATDYRGWYPYFADPKATQHVVRCGGYVAIFDHYFDQKRWWNFALGDGYYDGACLGERFWDPREGGTTYWSAYRYSASFLARPEFWNEKTRTGPSQWRAVRDADVLLPSRKAVVVHSGAWVRTNYSLDSYPFPPLTKIFFGLVDGGAGLYERSELGPWYPRGEGDWPGSSPSGNWGKPGIHTMDGARGFDLK